MSSNDEPTLPDPEATAPEPEGKTTEGGGTPQSPPSLPVTPDILQDLTGRTLFDRYRVERELGRGGMGRVVLAFDTKLHLRVALKLIASHLVPDKESINDLRQEVHRGMALTHPGIVRTHTFELDADSAAVVMEFIDGDTLADLREDQPGRCFDTDQLLPWLTPLCEIIDYAHREALIVHRDLKPRNIMLTRDGRIKVADFGIAATLTDTYTRCTGKEPSSGTPPYMSPQQAKGKRPNPSDDIYSLGATLYDLLTGKPPFFRGPHQAIIMQVCSVTPPTISERRSELGVVGKAPVPPAWEDAVAACLAKEPELRPPTAAAVLDRLRGAPFPSPAPAPRRSVQPRTLATLGLTTLIGLGGWWLRPGDQHPAEAGPGYIPSIEDRQALEKVRTLLDQQPAEAGALLARFPEGYTPADSLRAIVSARLDKAAQQAAQERQGKIDALLGQADAAIKIADWPNARAALHTIIKTYDSANNAAWAKLESIDAEKKSTEDLEAARFAQSYDDAQTALEKGDFARVDQVLSAVPAAYASAPMLGELRKRLALAKTAATEARLGEKERAEAEARRPTSKGKSASIERPPTSKANKSTPPPQKIPASANGKPAQAKPTQKPYRSFLTM